MKTQLTTHIGQAQPEPGGRAAAPGRLALAQRFINTWNQEFPVEQDRLGTTRAAAGWLRENGVVPDVGGAGAVPRSALAELREVREALRSLAADRHAAPGRERIYDGYPDVALDMISSRTFDSRIQSLEYSPRVLDGPPNPTTKTPD